MALLTTARNSLWDAIDHWPELQRALPDETRSIFEKTYRFDDEMPLLQELSPSLSRLPALAIFPATVTPAWYTHEMQHWPVLYDIVMWTPRWNVATAEDLVEKVLNALFRSSPEESSVSYVKAATGFYPLRVGPIAFSRVTGGSPDQPVKLIETRANVTLRTNKDPFAG